MSWTPEPKPGPRPEPEVFEAMRQLISAVVIPPEVAAKPSRPSAQPEPKFTPGPWRVEGPADAEMRNPHMGYWSVEGLTNVACHVTRDDARLIAAAPEMYEALNALMAASSEEEEFFAYQSARAAISKATGEG